MADNYQTLSVNQGPATQYGTDYPFVDAAASVKYLLGDLYLAYEDDECGFVLPLRVSLLSNFGTGSSGRRDVSIVDANDQIVFNTAAGSVVYTDEAWGKNLRTLAWVGETATLRCTMRTASPPWDAAKTWTNSISPGNHGALDGRTFMRVPRRVKSLRVGLTKMAGTIRLSEGYNIQMRLDDRTQVDGRRHRRRITVRARPGDGLGKLPGCQDIEPVIRRINGVEPTTGGDFTIDTQECYWLRRPAAIVSTTPRQASLGGDPFATMLTATINGMPDSYLAGDDKNATRLLYLADVDVTAQAALQILNDCGPCCTCDDFVSTHDGIRRLYEKYKLLAARASSVRDTYVANVARWEAQRNCRLVETLRLTLAAERNCGLFVGGTHCNMTECCATPLILRITYEAFRDGEPVDLTGAFVLKCPEALRAGADTNYDDVPYSPEGTFPVFDTIFDAADPQGTSRLRNRVAFIGCEDTDTIRVTLSVHMPEIRNRETGLPCTLPAPDDVDVPASVLALWADQPPLQPVRAVLTKTIPITKIGECRSC